ncbi:MAG: geranylgeranylglycerol-phosphate geranylgeranyltransferase [Bacteroidota bacterium]
MIVVFVQYLFRYCIIEPILLKNGFSFGLSDFEFFLLVFATVLVTAAGYAINDYFDLKTDRINKPHKIILGKKLSRRKAIFSHSFLNIIAVLIGVYLAYRVNFWSLSAIFVIIPTLLFFYSIRYKRKFFIGNFIVSVLAAFVIAIVWIFEFQAIAIKPNVDVNQLRESTALIGHFLRIYALFAFLTTLLREVVKDIEDIKGDVKIGCKTIPIVSGVRNCKNFLIILSVIIILFTGYFQILMLSQENPYNMLFLYLLLLVQIPLILTINKIHIAKEKLDYNIISKLVKFIMISGIFSMFLLYFYLSVNEVF